MKKSTLILSLLIVLLTACQTAQPTQPAEAQAGTAQPSTQAPNVQASGDLCANPYIPAVEGATWTSNLHSDLGDTTQVDTVTDVGTDAFLVETTQADITYVITWTCTPDGLLWLQTDGGMFSGVFPNQQWSTSSFSGVTIPKGLQPGDSWSSSQEMMATDANGTSRTFTINIDYQALAIESVTVPAGTFNAMRIDFVMQFTSPDFDSGYHISDWFVENVGLVKSVAQADFGSYSVELVSYSIP